LAAGTDGLETDVCLTSDGELVLLHDPLLSVGTTLDGWAHERTAAEIAQARILDRHRVPTAERPLTLDELLTHAPADLPNTGTVNDAELLARVSELASPDAVCTDRPAELRAEVRRLEVASSNTANVDAEFVTAGSGCA
jgi:hypothetical protein